MVLAMDRPNRRDSFLQAVGEFWDYLQEGRLEIYMFGERDTKAFSLASEIQRKDLRVDPTDAAIVGCFLADEGAAILYTTDRDLWTSRVVQEMARERAKKIKGL